MIKLPDLMHVTRLLENVAATEILSCFQCLGENDVREKEPGDLVSIADEACEAALSEMLPRILPDSLVVGEESVAADADVIDRLLGEAPIWVIDPLDGTKNFVMGHEYFALMVALVWRNETIAAWIHDPLTKQTLMAEQGAGARDQAGQIITLPKQEKKSISELPISEFPMSKLQGYLALNYAPANARHQIKANMNRFGFAQESVKSLGCAGHEYLGLVRGMRHFSSYHRTKVWDHAPGILIHTEAGGYSARFDGQPYRPNADERGGIFCAPDRICWEKLHAILFENIMPVSEY